MEYAVFLASLASLPKDKCRVLPVYHFRAWQRLHHESNKDSIYGTGMYCTLGLFYSIMILNCSSRILEALYLVPRINTCGPYFCTYHLLTNRLASVTSIMLFDWLEFRSWSDRDYKYLSLGLNKYAIGTNLRAVLSVVEKTDGWGHGPHPLNTNFLFKLYSQRLCSFANFRAFWTLKRGTSISDNRV
jgi:hypothetical protein